MNRYVALLRGINVGGKNVIRMADLRSCFLNLGFEEVSTYIQSGNVLFSSSQEDLHVLVQQIEKGLSATFHYTAAVVLLSQAHMHRVIVEAPDEFGRDASAYKYNVLFLREGILAHEAILEIPAKEGVDRVWAGEGVLYFSQLKSRVTQSYLTRLIGQPLYRELTIRNWNTTRKLGEMG